MLVKIVKNVLEKFGLKIQRIQKTQKTFECTMRGALQRCSNRGLPVNSVIDVGASDGRWSKICMEFLPNAKYLLIEAQDAHKKGLDQFKAENGNVDYILAAAGRKEGKIYFDNSDLFGGSASEVPLGKKCIQVPVVTIDGEIKKRRLEPPFLIKLDTHGFEIPIIEGALDIIKSAELLIIETYNYKLTNNSLRYFEMCVYLEKIGFSSIETVDLMLRKYDDSFWQMDTFYIPSNRKEFTYNSYK